MLGCCEEIKGKCFLIRLISFLRISLNDKLYSVYKIESSFLTLIYIYKIINCSLKIFNQKYIFC